MLHGITKKEIEDLNKKSQEGWQLVKGGCFKSIYEQNDTVSGMDQNSIDTF